jgi:D-amino peptidase
MAATRGLDVRLSIPARAMRELSRVADLYWLTHLYLLDTRYLRAAPRHPDATAWTEELLIATPWVVEQGNVDLGAELAFCLQCVGEAGGGAHEALLSLLERHQLPDGRMEDAHATAGALLAFAGAEERQP